MRRQEGPASGNHLHPSSVVGCLADTARAPSHSSWSFPAGLEDQQRRDGAALQVLQGILGPGPAPLPGDRRVWGQRVCWGGFADFSRCSLTKVSLWPVCGGADLEPTCLFY